MSTAEKFVTPMPLPTDREREILTILIEECAEVQQRAIKMLRFGVDEVQPGQELSNSDRLSLEIGDLEVIVNMAAKAGLVSEEMIELQKDRKRAKLAKYMQTAAE